MELVTFALLGALAVGCALGVIAARSAVHSAVFLLVSLASVAALFVVLWAEFLAVVQLMVYAGGVMVLFMFVIMLVDLERRGAEGGDRLKAKPTRPMKWVWTLMAVLLVGLLLTVVLLDRPASGPVGEEAVRQALQGGFAEDGVLIGNTERIGVLLYTSYLIPFELASVLLLVAMIGAVVLAHWKREEEGS